MQFTTVTLETLEKLGRGLGVRTGSLLGARPSARRAADRRAEVILAENVLVMRSAKGWTQEALSARAEVSRPMIARIESLATKPDVRTLVRLAEALGVSPERLLSERRSKPKR